MSTGQPRFLADAMLHGLARWLRVLGLDVSVHPEHDDPVLVAIARQEGRILLTRDRALLNDLRPDRFLYIEAAKPLEQLCQVIRECRLEPPAELFTRCLRCNAELRPADQKEVMTLVPEPGRQMPGPFRRCPRCGRVYWPGTHTRRMRQLLAGVLPDWFGEKTSAGLNGAE